MAAWFPYDVHILVITLLVLVWYHFKNAYDKYKESKIPYVKPILPFGNITKSTFRLRPIVDDLHEVYNAFPDHKYVGFFQLDKSVIILRDPELMKQIAVKDFEHFLNHQGFVTEDNDPLFGKNVFSLTGDKWRDMRSTLSPAFTSSKMKNMFTFMSDCGSQVNEYLMGEIRKNKDGDKQSVCLEFKDLSTRYTSDVIASTAFGVKVDSLHDKNNEFYETGKIVSNFDGIIILKFFGYIAFPKLMKFLKVRLFSEETSNFYRNLVQETMKLREKENIHRPDMIHLLMEAKRGTLKYEEKDDGEKAGFATVEESSQNIGIIKRKTKIFKEVKQRLGWQAKSSNFHSVKVNSEDIPGDEWEDDDLTAQAVLFFLAGFDTVSNLMCFVMYELAVNPEIQKRLHEEIDASLEENGDSLSYDVLQKLNYLDMIVSETLRKWPPSIITDRSCTKEYNLAPSKERSNDGIKLLPNDIVWLPIYSIQRDPKYWPNPDKFDPERFSDENKNNIKPCTYIPFGVGPRNCIGSRYALMEIKVLVYSLMSTFNVDVNRKKMTVPLELSRKSFDLKAKEGFWMTFETRK